MSNYDVYLQQYPAMVVWTHAPSAQTVGVLNRDSTKVVVMKGVAAEVIARIVADVEYGLHLPAGSVTVETME